MKISKISRIREYGVFRNFDWPDDLPEFRKFNVIYGWNGSGKTLFSRIFTCLQNKQTPICKEIILQLSTGVQIRSTDFLNPSLDLSIRVFNRDFVEENVYRTASLQPIYVLSKEAKEKQQKLENLNERIQAIKEKQESKNKEIELMEKNIDTLCSNGAKLVRETLSLTGRQYEREQFRRDLNFLEKQDDIRKYMLDEETKERLQDLIRTEQRGKLETINISFISFASLFRNAKDLCSQSVAISAIKELRENEDINFWVEQGLILHKKHASEKCLFCDQPMPKVRLMALEAHFSKEYEELVEKIEKLIGQISRKREELNRLNFPDINLFYPDLRRKYQENINKLFETKEYLISVLGDLLGILESKRRNPFQNLENAVQSLDVSDENIEEINRIIEDHNKKVDHHEEEIAKAKERIKWNIIANEIPKYKELKNEVRTREKEKEILNIEKVKLRKEYENTEKELIDIRRPAEELNKELESYLGHDEIRFEIENTGYRIMRNGEQAFSLSDGEKTAIAFLYFLKTLESKDFNSRDGIVVIDDPVSSLDSTAIYYAFGFMRSRLEERIIRQLFILTHNYLFFRQIKNWFRYHENDARYYMLNVKKENNERNSKIVELDPLLRDFESEYQYLFSLVYKAANDDNYPSDLSQYYYLPNVIRRLLEAFLEFKVPMKGSIYRKLENIDFDSAKKERIRRFCDAHSHCRVIDEAEQDQVILGEARYVAKDIMDLIKETDEGHYKGMKQLTG